MAITANCSKFLFYSRSLGASFEKTLMLGRLNLFAKPREINEQVALFGGNGKQITARDIDTEYAEPLFKFLGAKEIDSIDYSDYEKATIIHDLNKPIPGDLKNRFTAVVDGGTIEHVFNFPQAIKNCMQALQKGGHYIGITPANNLMGHGFYQFSPELYFRVFSPQFGFIVKKVCLVTQNKNEEFSDWYEVNDPEKVKNRIMITNDKATYLMVLAQKIEDRDLENFVPQQSDYQARWAIEEALEQGKAAEGEGKIKYLYRKYCPVWVKKLIHSFVRKRQEKNSDLGMIGSGYFEKIRFERKNTQ